MLVSGLGARPPGVRQGPTLCNRDHSSSPQFGPLTVPTGRFPTKAHVRDGLRGTYLAPASECVTVTEASTAFLPLFYLAEETRLRAATMASAEV
jgi:hypothetical protein